VQGSIRSRWQSLFGLAVCMGLQLVVLLTRLGGVCWQQGFRIRLELVGERRLFDGLLCGVLELGIE